MGLKEDIPKIVEWIKYKVEESGRTGCMVGVSGGIDSAVIVSLCKRAFPDTTFGLSMPMLTNTDGASRKRAIELCEQLDVPLALKQISPLKSIPNESKLTKSQIDVAKGNYYARQRMANLYLGAECNDALVIGTDNAVENYIGYFTKFGDGGVDMNPIAKYVKSEVKELGRLLGVTDAILNATPSAELFEDQTDEGELGMSYDDIEWAMTIIKNWGNLHYAAEDTLICYNEYSCDENCYNCNDVDPDYKKLVDIFGQDSDTDSDIFQSYRIGVIV